MLSGLLLCGSLTVTTVFAQGINQSTSRISGKDRYETSVAISKAGWSEATSVIIASGLDYPDALAASALSKLKDAPILLTQKDALAPITLAEIKRLKATQVFLMGGTGVIGEGIESQLKGLGIGITRIGGIDRYDTSKKIAEIIGVNNGIIVSSDVNFPDALSIATIAGMKSIPILLSPKDSLNPSIAAFIKGKTIPVSYIVGGTGVLSSSIESSLPNSKRLGDVDRYATNLKINNEFAGDFNFDTVYLASGNNFADALSGSALAVKSKAPIFLTNKDSISDATINFIKSKNVKHVIILGGTGAISTDVEKIVYTAVSSPIIPGTIQPPISGGGGGSNNPPIVVPPTTVIKVTTISLNKTTDNLIIGSADTIIATLSPTNSTNQAVNWTSSANSIATVDNAGKVTGVTEGIATITATSVDGSLTADCVVTINSNIITFKDGNLETVVRGIIKKATGPLYKNDVANITVLDTSNYNIIITDLTGIENLKGLQKLNLNNNQISNITALQGLTNLTSIYLSGNLISDITSLQGLTNLTFLDLDNNKIIDTTALQGLNNLTELHLSGNQISAITALQGLNRLVYLDLSSNKISSITALKGLTNLVYLDLSSNLISGITDLQGLFKLTTLYLNSNSISVTNIALLASSLLYCNIIS